MIVAGVDVGSTQTKAVVMDDHQRILGQALLDTGARLTEVATTAFHRALEAGGCAEGDVAYVVGTGYGRFRVAFGHAQVTEISCHAREGPSTSFRRRVACWTSAAKTPRRSAWARPGRCWISA